MATVTVKLSDLVDCQPAINDIESQKLNRTLGFRWMKISRKIVGEIKDFYELRQKMEQDMGLDAPPAEDVNSEQLQARRKLERKFVEELRPVLAEDVTLEIPLLDEKALDGVELKGSTYRLLWFVFEEEGKEDA